MGMMVRERGADGTSIVDLLDSSMVRNMVAVGRRGGGGGGGRGTGPSADAMDSDSDSDEDGDEGPELGFRDGKIVIPGGDSDGDEEDEGGSGKGRKRGRDDGGDDGDDGPQVVDTGKGSDGFVHMAGRKARAKAAAQPAQASASQGRSSGARGPGGSTKRQKVAAVRGMVTGSEYRSKKSGGDVKRKGVALEPYAYIPLDGRTLTGRKQGGQALKQYQTVVKKSDGKKGYQRRTGGKRRK